MNNKIKKEKFSILILIVITLVLLTTSVYAATVGQTVGFLGIWKWFIVNAFLIFVILFILQATLVPEKLEKERAVMWVMMIGLSLGISWFISSSGYIWHHPKIGLVFNQWTPVNAAIITLVVIIVLPWVGVKLEAPRANVGMWILVGVVATAISINLGSHYIWQEPAYQGIKDFLFGEKGVLTIDPSKNNYRLMVFITMSVVWAWLLSTLKVSEKTPKISYALAILIAAQMAHGGLALKNAVQLTQLAAIIILGNQLSKSWGANEPGMKFLAYAVIYGLVEWATWTVDKCFTIWPIVWFSGCVGGTAAGAVRRAGGSFNIWLFIIVIAVEVVAIIVINKLLNKYVFKSNNP